MSHSVVHALQFMASSARVLDRRRLAALLDPSSENVRAIVRSLGAYANPDGGFGLGIEPDLRAVESQPAGALHALEALADAREAAEFDVAAHAMPLLDWLTAHTLPEGALPFALPISDPTACSPFWVRASPSEPSLQITAAVAVHALRLARLDSTVRAHPWVSQATDYCMAEYRVMTERPKAYVLSFGLQFLDAATDVVPGAAEVLQHLMTFVPEDGLLPVAGGAENEAIHLLTYSPVPGRPIRSTLDDNAVQREVSRLRDAQQADGGWIVDFDSASPAAALEWRGYTTVQAVRTLLLHGALEA